MKHKKVRRKRISKVPPTVSAEELHEARVRGLIDPSTVAQLTGTSVCVACGRKFPYEGGHPRLFGCACCALSIDIATVDRRIGPKTKVVLIKEGVAGTVVKVHPKGAFAWVRLESDKQPIKATVNEIERIFYVKVRHFSDCGHKTEDDMRLAAKVKKATLAKARAVATAHRLSRIRSRVEEETGEAMTHAAVKRAVAERGEPPQRVPKSKRHKGRPKGK